MAANLITYALALGACLRLTRLVVDDDIAEPFRQKIHALTHRKAKPNTLYGGAWGFVSRLIACPWCASVWLSAGIVAAAVLIGDSLWFRVPAGVLTLAWLVGIISSWLDSPPPVKHIVHHTPDTTSVRVSSARADVPGQTTG
ncbi:DUF1360 domain-containing protein [Streptomyces sp. NPDC005395]|uniref:DUF1360 domain-containing protein n=1 Tax=Streptomyces sp. NPDC005395 TaxID=3157042 RepID=UPI0033AA9330